MALDTSSSVYEDLFVTSDSENDNEYYSGYIEVKGKLMMWSQYWGVLKARSLFFFKDMNTHIKENYVGHFHLDAPTNIEIKGPKEWVMKTKAKKITLRTQLTSLRESWINAFKQSMNGEPPTKESYILPGSGPVSPPTSPAKPQFSPPQSPPGGVSRKGSLQYIMTEEQKKRLEEFANNQTGSVNAMTNAELEIQEQLLKEEKSWYQGVLRREVAEGILQKEKEGTFVVRDYIDGSTKRNMGYVISLKDEKGEIRHHKILKQRNGFHINGYPDHVFETLPKLLLFFIASQRKKVILKPYNPNEQQVSETSGPYLEMDGSQSQPPFNGSSNGMSSNTSSLQRAASFQERYVLPSEIQYMPVRAQSVTEHLNRRLPPTPPAPSNGMARANSIQNRALPKTPDESYEEMTSPVKRVPPAIPTQTDSPDGGSSYVNLPPRLPASYENMAPSSGYINIPGGGFGHHEEEEQAPRLPPKKRSSSVKEIRPYVNLPARGDRPPRPPLRKAFTLERM